MDGVVEYYLVMVLALTMRKGSSSTFTSLIIFLPSSKLGLLPMVFRQSEGIT